MDIKILGTGCPKCQSLEAAVKKAVSEMKIKDASIEHVKDINRIIEYGVMSTPALVIDGKVKTAGKIPSVEELKKMLA
jgi:small redox-active disulfide protein 2